MPRSEMMFSGPVVDFIERFPERANSSLHSEALSTAFLKSSRTSPRLHLPVSSRSPSHTVSPTKESARELKLTHRDAAVHYAEENIIKVVGSSPLLLGVNHKQVVPALLILQQTDSLQKERQRQGTIS